MTKTHHCPICQKKIDLGQGETESHFPFCSQRCRLVDLGKWFSGEYAIPVDDSTAIEGELSDDET